MALPSYKDAVTGTNRYRKARGTGAPGDPDVPESDVNILEGHGLATQETLAAALTQLQAAVARLNALTSPADTQPVSGPLTNTQLRAAPVQAIDPIAYYASAAGGRVAFNITTAVVSLNGASEQALAALVNPADSGKDMILDVGEFGASVNTTFRRYRNSIITPTGAPRTATNMGGGAATSVAQMYIGGASPTFTRSGGLVAKDAFIQAYDTYFAYLRGRNVLRPGQSLSWTIQGTGGNFTASIYFEYYELPAAV